MDFRQGATYTTYAEFQHHFDVWCSHQGVVFTIAYSKSVDWANKHISPGEKPYGALLKHKYVTFKCKHGPTKPSESKGIRTHLRTHNKLCPAQINLCADQGDPQVIRVTKVNNVHENHPVSKDHASHLPERRRLNEEEVAIVETMGKVGGKPSKIASFVRERTGKKTICRDIYNILQRAKKNARGSKTELEHLQEVLKAADVEDPGGCYIFGYREENASDEGDNIRNDVAYIFIQTASMKRSFTKFPEVLGMDTTHKVNKNQYHLIVMQCTDNHGNGRVIAYCLIEGETKDVIQASLIHLKTTNPDAAEEIITLLVDKDLKEISMAHEVLPHVQVHLCYVHVIGIFKKETKDEVNKSDVLALLKAMAKCASKEEFDKLYSDLKLMCSPRFIEYFDKNWKEIREGWVLFVRNTCLTLGIDTTNQTESHNALLRRETAKANSAPEFCQNIIRVERNREVESSHKDHLEVATRSYVANNNDPEVKQIYSALCSFAAKYLFAEWRESKGLSYVDEDLQTTISTCTCNFYVKFLMGHCSHIFWTRRHQGLPILCLEGVRKRWLKPTFEEPAQHPEVNGNGLQIVRMQTPQKNKVMDQNGRYNEALRVCTDVASLISSTGGNQFLRRMEVLSELRAIFLSGKEARCLPDGSAGDSQNQPQGHDESTGTDMQHPSFEQSTKSHNDDASETDDSEGDGPICCNKCKQPLQRSVVQRNSMGNQGRYFLSCPQKCGNVFRWLRCPYCDTRNVRLNHKCLPMPDDMTIETYLEDAEEDEDDAISTTSTVASEPEDPVSSAKPTDVGNFNIGIDALLNEEEEAFEEELAQLDLESLVQNLDSLVEKERKLSSAAVATIPPNDIGIKYRKLTVDQSKSYNKALKIDDLEVIPNGYAEWKVTSQEDHIQQYTVQRKLASCRKQVCEGVVLCFHRYTCDCDHRANPCKHIFKVFMKYCPDEASQIKPVAIPDSKTSGKPRRRGKLHVLSGQEVTLQDLVLRPGQTIRGRPRRSHKWRYSRRGNDGKHQDELEEDVDSPPTADNSRGLPTSESEAGDYERDVPSPVFIQNEHGNGEEVSLLTEVANFLDVPTFQSTVKFRGDALKYSADNLNTLQIGRWLDDSVISKFVDLALENIPADVRVYKVQSHALSSIPCGWRSLRKNLEEGVLKDKAIFSDVWVAQSLIEGNHWILFVVSIPRKSIWVLNSKNYSSKTWADQLKVLQYLIQLSHEALLGVAPDWSEWHFYAPRDVMKQIGPTDCGVFLCIWIYAIATTTQIASSYIMQHMTGFRALIAHKLQEASEPCSPHKQGSGGSTKDPSNNPDRFDDDCQEYPWRTIPTGKIDTACRRETHTVMAELLDHPWKATDSECASENGCRGREGDKMFLCEACRDYFHLQCINHNIPEPQDDYLCPRHIEAPSQGGRRKRKTPARYRVSLG